MMDAVALAGTVTPILAPYLPTLLSLEAKAGEGVAGEVGKQAADVAFGRAKALWAVLHPRMETKPTLQEAAQEVASNPKDEDAQAALRLQLRKLFAADSLLAEEVAAIWEKTRPSGVVVTASGERSVAIGWNASQNTIITGDSNTIRPKE